MRERDERGAVAVMVGLLVVVLFGVAALTVDLGNAWARKRAVQKQVDVSALAAGAALPTVAGSLDDRHRVATEVALWLTRNRVSGQPESVTAEQLLDADVSNGHIVWLRADGSACEVTQSCDRMRVISPTATVDFGLAGVFGASDASVQRAASVTVASEIPDPLDLVPFWLPSGCASGPAWLDTAQGNQGKFSAAVEAEPEASGEPTTIPSDVVQGTHQILGPLTPPSMAVNQSGAVSGALLTAIPSNVDRASIRFVAPDGTWHEYAAVDVGKTDPLTVPAFEVGTEVTSVPGTWRVFGVVQQKNDNHLPRISANHLTFEVVGEAPVVPDDSTSVVTPVAQPVGCWGQDRGNFGQLDSPRKGFTGKTLALNIATGFDHTLVPFVFASPELVTKDCGKAGRGIDGSRQDTVSEDGRNCIVGDPGNDPPGVTQGFVTGVDGVPGRLAAARGATTCEGRSDVSVLGTLLNDDVLSCFLPDDTTTLEQLTGSGPGTPQLDIAVTRSPRFVWVPVVHAADRAQKDFQPILDFVPGFITSELPSATRGAPGVLGASNGLLTTDQKIKAVQVFVFSKDALPIDERNPTTTYAESVGRKIVRLVQ